MARLLIFGVPMMLLLATAAIMLTVLPEEDAPAVQQELSVQQPDPAVQDNIPPVPAFIPLYEVEWTQDLSPWNRDPDQQDITEGRGTWYMETLRPYIQWDPWFLTPLVKDGSPLRAGGITGLFSNDNIWVAVVNADICLVKGSECVYRRNRGPGPGKEGATDRLFVSADWGETWIELVPPADQRNGTLSLAGIARPSVSVSKEGETAYIRIGVEAGRTIIGYQVKVPVNSPPTK